MLCKRQIKSKGFTLIELIVAIAIIAVLAVVLITIIDPQEKVLSSQDVAMISAVKQFGAAEDNFAALHDGYYAGGSGLNSTLMLLNATGDSRISSFDPNGYTITFLNSPSAGCVSGISCSGYAFVLQLKARKYLAGIPPVAGPFFQVVNGNSCYVATGITSTQLDALDGSSEGPGGC